MAAILSILGGWDIYGRIGLPCSNFGRNPAARDSCARQAEQVSVDSVSDSTFRNDLVDAFGKYL